MVKVSVCITTYNLESYISQTLDSILSQKTTFDYEIIVGDDFSTDKTRDILLQYKREFPGKIILHLQERNAGVNHNDYDLINLAKGEYIAWCDGDDFWLTEDKLQKQVEILDTNPKFSCVHTHWVDHYEKDGREQAHTINQKVWEREINGDRYVERFIAGDTSGCRLSSLMFRKRLVVDFISKDPSVYLTVPHKQNDFALFCILSYYGPFYLLPEYTTAYRIREVSLSMGNNTIKRINYIIAFLNLIVYLSKAFNINKQVANKTIRRNVATILHYIYCNIKERQWNTTLQELAFIVSDTGYKYTFGQRLLILSIKQKFIYYLTKPLFDFLYKRHSR